jgi:hypothetical protein
LNRLAIALALCAFVALLSALALMFGQPVDWRLGPVRIRAHGAGRALAVAGVLSFALWSVTRPRTAGRTLAVVLLGAALIVGVSAYGRGAPDLVPSGDLAVIESYTIHATGANAFLGPYSRYAWNHPGPAYFYLLAPLYGLSGHKTATLFAASAAINVAALAAFVLVTLRHAQPTLALAVAAAGAFYTFLIRHSLATAWNPHVLPLPMMAMIVVCAALASGRIWALPWVALLASFLVQTHIGAGPAVLAVAAAGLLAAAITVYRSNDVHRRRQLLRAVNLTSWLLALLWLMPIVEQLSRPRGNLTELWAFWASDRDGQPFVAAWRAWTQMLAAFAPGFEIPPTGLSQPRWTPWMPYWAAVQVVLVCLATAWSARARHRFDTALGAMLLIASGAALWSITRIADGLVYYAIFWVSGIGALSMALIAHMGAAILWTRGSPLSPRAVAGGCALFVVCAAGIAFQQVGAMTDRAARHVGTDLHGLRFWQALDAHRRRHGLDRPLIRIDQAAWEMAAALVVGLQKAKEPFAVEDGWLPMFSDSVAATGDEQTVLTLARPAAAEQLLKESGHTVLADRAGIIMLLGPAPSARSR